MSAAKIVLILVIARSFRNRTGSCCVRFFLFTGYPRTKPLNDVKADGNEEYGEQCRRHHAANHTGTQDLTRDAAGSSSSPQRNATENEGECRHQNWAKS